MSLPIFARCQPLSPALLPYTTPAAAWQAILRTTPELILWPVLSRRSLQEQPWAWAALGFPGLAHDQPHLDPAAFDRGLDALYLSYLQHDLDAAAVQPVERALSNPPWPEGALEHTRLLGARLLGPISLGLSIIDDEERPILMSFERRDALAKFLRLRAAWLESVFSRFVPRTLICFDEPFLDALQSSFLQFRWEDAILLLEEAFAGLQGGRGLAPGCHGDWAAILRLSIDLVICPAEEWERLLAASEMLRDYLQRGGLVVWALIPSDEAVLEAVTAAEIASQFDQVLARATAAEIDEFLLVQNSLLTIDGSLDHLSTAYAERALALLSDASVLVRSRYGFVEEPVNVFPSQP